MSRNQNVPQVRFKGFTDLPAGRQALGKWYAYVLLCDDGSLYKGKTNNIERRMNEHLSGAGAEHTKKHKPIELVHLESFETEKGAIEVENGGERKVSLNGISAPNGKYELNRLETIEVFDGKIKSN